MLHLDLRLRWGLKQSHSPHRELSNNMSHATYTRGNQNNSWLLVVRSEIANLIPGPSFIHSLCVKCPNGSCKPILDTYVLRTFQWYKEFFNPLEFWPLQLLSENLGVRRDSNSQSSLRSVKVHSLTFSYNCMKCDSKASLLAFWPCKLLPWLRTQG
jgi:hypothetical protein